MEQFAAKEIGARIALARLERGLTQEELAEMAPFSRRSLQDYETGVTIPYRHMKHLSRLLRRPEEWFLYGDETATNKESGVAVMERLDRIEGLLSQLVEVSRPSGEEAGRLSVAEAEEAAQAAGKAARRARPRRPRASER